MIPVFMEKFHTQISCTELSSGILGKNLFPVHPDYWQNSVPCSCRMVSLPLLAAHTGSLFTPKVALLPYTQPLHQELCLFVLVASFIQKNHQSVSETRQLLCRIKSHHITAGGKRMQWALLFVHGPSSLWEVSLFEMNEADKSGGFKSNRPPLGFSCWKFCAALLLESKENKRQIWSRLQVSSTRDTPGLSWAVSLDSYLYLGDLGLQG